MTFREYLSELFFPPKCRCCKKPIRREQAPFCKECLARYQREKYALCPTCHKPHCRCVCRPKGATASVFYRSVFPYRTQSPGGRLILALKTGRIGQALPFLPENWQIAFGKPPFFRKMRWSPLCREAGRRFSAPGPIRQWSWPPPWPRCANWTLERRSGTPGFPEFRRSFPPKSGDFTPEPPIKSGKRFRICRAERWCWWMIF